MTVLKSSRYAGLSPKQLVPADVAARLIAQSCAEGKVDPRGLVLHSDNGKAMRGSAMLSTLQWLGVIPRHDGREAPILASRDALYQRMRRANPERWSGRTRNWWPWDPSCSIPNLLRSRRPHDRCDNYLDAHRQTSLSPISSTGQRRGSDTKRLSR